ncbi:MAG: nucleotidyltransferase domain-containing protein [Hyphomicrobiaceae bacterium]
MDPTIVRSIDERLRFVEASQDVRIAFAIESGSRAWGFPSPDSDYDCRFVFVRRREDYLALYPKRDVIETPLDATFDVNGWDLKKAIRLLLSGNAVIVEWLTSPIVYRAEPNFRQAFIRLADEVGKRDRFMAHYYHLARRQFSLVSGNDVPLKKVFYVLRPLAALRWLAAHAEACVAPMHFPTLCAELDLDEALKADIAMMIAAKAITREATANDVPPRVKEFVRQEMARLEGVDFRTGMASAEDRDKAEGFFLSCLRRA